MFYLTTLFAAVSLRLKLEIFAGSNLQYFQTPSGIQQCQTWQSGQVRIQFN